MPDDAPFETRQVRARSGALPLLTILLLGLPLAMTLFVAFDEEWWNQPEQLALLAPFVALFLLGCFRVFPQRLRVHGGTLEWSGVTGSARVRPEDVLGISWPRMHSGEPSWPDDAVLRTTAGRIHLGSFRDEGALGERLRTEVFPRVAAAFADRLGRGRPVALGQVTATAEGFTLRGLSAGWAEPLEVDERPEGWLLQVPDRPHQATLVRRRELPELPLLLALIDEMRARGGGAEAGAAGHTGPPDPATRPGGAPADPELGAVLFERTVPLWARALTGMVMVTGAVTVMGMASCVAVDSTSLSSPGGVAPTALGGVPFGVLVVLFMLFGWLEPPTGDSFVVHEEGIAAPSKRLRWDDIESIELSATEHYTRHGGGDPVYDYTDYDVHVWGPGAVAFHLGGFGPETEAFYTWFGRAVVPRLASRDLARIRDGEAVEWGWATLDSQGIRTDGGQLDWDAYAGKALVKGTLHLYRIGPGEPEPALTVAMSEPNAHLLLAILEAYETSLAEGEADGDEDRDEGAV